MSIKPSTNPPKAAQTRVFMNGNSQAVRIPQEFRLDCQQVQISRNADGDIVLRPVPPVPQRRGDALLQVLQSFDPSFVQALEEERAQGTAWQEREPL
ncbi:antitoxin [Ideonella sp.]|uniref:antitoxin n=1 Tax=Ideonella sp. TaxID=1929293 RepID=UPI0037BE269C